MSHIKFNHVFAFLLVLSLLSAFVIPPEYTNKALPQVQSIFAPVSGPARRVGAWVHGRVAPHESPDKRKAEDVKTENQLLRARVIELTEQIDLERKRNAQWESLRSLKEQSVPVEIAGADSGTRDSLALQGSTLEHVRDKAVAFYPGGVAGQIQGRAGVAGAQLRLITDPGFRVRGHFVRMTPEAKPLPLSPELVFLGVGNALTLQTPLSQHQIKEYGLEIGDVAVAAEREWPQALRGTPLGSVTKMTPRHNAAGFIDVRIEPPVNLKLLDEVMVMKK